MGIPLILFGLIVGTIAFVSWTLVRDAQISRRRTSTDDGTSGALFDGGDTGSADCGDGADGGGCDGGGGDGGGGGD